MNEGIEIVSADPRDTVGSELTGEIAAFIARMYPEDSDEPLAPWTLEDMMSRGAFVLAYVDGAPAGCGGLVPVEVRGAFEIVRMYVRPAHRGLRLGGRILETLERRARDRGATVLVLRCGPRQPEALRMYEAGGYRRRPAFAQHEERPTNVFLEKRIAPGSERSA